MTERKMLIDAVHPEELRMVVTCGDKVEEFDIESSRRQRTRGNVYLAKITRIEPSLQAAFVDYGAERQGFLTFSEIHPDYYQIPLATRKAYEDLYQDQVPDDAATDGDDTHESIPETFDEGAILNVADSDSDSDSDIDSENASLDITSEVSEQVSWMKRRNRLLRAFKIQEVIKRQQVILVQVIKEERGNKGAALTTYLSLAGRYCVFMPNTPEGGGVSRKVHDDAERRRLKSFLAELEIASMSGLIIRTAGAQRSKLEIKRDYDSLKMVWEELKEKTMTSMAPSLIYNEGDLIRRSIRDFYTKDVSSVIVDGEEGYKEARRAMRFLMPSHTKFVHLHEGKAPLFQDQGVEEYLDMIIDQNVPLSSGGYLVINQTEALVTIDINSGRATKERTIETTAFKTNLEATEEIARQLRIRDLAGLVVVDFIDMDLPQNRRAIEKGMRDALKKDRARIQIGRISSFGLLEMSRQRLRLSLSEDFTKPCPMCLGRGEIYSTSALALKILRNIETQATKGVPLNILKVRAHADALAYILSHKRSYLASIESRFGISVFFETSQNGSGSDYEIIAQAEVSQPDEDSSSRETSSRGSEQGQRSSSTEERGQGRRRRRSSRSDREGRPRRDASQEKVVSQVEDVASEEDSTKLTPSRDERQRGRRTGERGRSRGSRSSSSRARQENRKDTESGELLQRDRNTSSSHKKSSEGESGAMLSVQDAPRARQGRDVAKISQEGASVTGSKDADDHKREAKGVKSRLRKLWSGRGKATKDKDSEA